MASTIAQNLASWLHAIARSLTPGGSTPPDPTELDDLIDHLAFEVAAVESAADLYLRHSYWVFLDTFLLHARLLRDFLWGSPNIRYAKTEVLAEHYSKSWPSTRPSMPATLRATKKAINAQLAHISRARVRPKKVRDLGVDLVSIRDDIRAGWKAFVNNLGADPRATNFRTAVAQKCAALRVAPPP